MRQNNELTVITKAKDLASYVMTVTQKSPKQFRFSFVGRMQNLVLEVIENLYRANDTFVVNNDMKVYYERLEYQRKAMTSIKLLNYMALLATEQKCLLPKQYEQIARLSSDCQNMLGAWMTSDRKRLL